MNGKRFITFGGGFFLFRQKKKIKIKKWIIAKNENVFTKIKGKKGTLFSFVNREIFIWKILLKLIIIIGWVSGLHDKNYSGRKLKFFLLFSLIRRIFKRYKFVSIKLVHAVNNFLLFRPYKNDIFAKNLLCYTLKVTKNYNNKSSSLLQAFF